VERWSAQREIEGGRGMLAKNLSLQKEETKHCCKVKHRCMISSHGISFF